MQPETVDAALSAFAPAGVEADTLLHLFWIMVAGAAVVWMAVLAIAAYAALSHSSSRVRIARRVILVGGVATPTLVLGVLLVYGLLLMPRLRAAVPADALRITVSGEQWWWRVRYAEGGVDTANEIRIPAGRPVALTLTSPDVIHSFWVPALAGKVDMIPGRSNTLVLRARRAGVFRGVCAEFCGTSHAQMRMLVVAMAPTGFDRWLQRQATPAQEPRSELQRSGRRAFLANGCGACHAVRGTPAVGAVGPDLTHVGSRLELAAGTLPNDSAAFGRWIAAPHAAKPDALMPDFGMLPDADLAAISAWLESLQ